jgi:uncharacterized membrane protein
MSIKKQLWRISALFTLVYLLIVLVNHFCFRTYALDLGIYTNALYDYAHFQLNDAISFKTEAQNLLSDHLDLSLIFISPLAYLFGQYTLLLVQVASIILGGFGLTKWVEIKLDKSEWQAQVMLAFYFFFGVYSALSFVYHSNVLAACLLPWLLVLMHQKKWVKMYLIALLMLLTKESVALWLFGIAVFIAVSDWQIKTVRKHAVILMLGSVFYFYLAIVWMMPALSITKTYSHFKYHVLGNTYAEALQFCFFHPFELVRILFVNTTHVLSNQYVKLEFWLFILFSGAWALLFLPRYVLLLMVPLLSKMAYDDPAIWSIDCHYSIEFAPVLVMLLAEFKKKFTTRFLPWPFLIALNALVTIRLMDHTVYLHDYQRLRLYQKGHFTRGYDLAPIYEALSKIPDTAVVSAQTAFMPHLAYRSKAYQFPIVKDAHWIIVSPLEDVTYPLSLLDFSKTVSTYLLDSSWQVIYQRPEVILLHKP